MIFFEGPGKEYEKRVHDLKAARAKALRQDGRRMQCIILTISFFTWLALFVISGYMVVTTTANQGKRRVIYFQRHPCLSASVQGKFPTGVAPVKMEIF